MKDYNSELKKHLVEYATRELGLYKKGGWGGKEYAHILAADDGLGRKLNLLPHCREEFWTYAQGDAAAGRPGMKWHRNAYHLNSSQVLAFNLFFPFLSRPAVISSAGSFFQRFGRITPLRWEFESVPDSEEKTNVDVMWEDVAGVRLYCEVKLSENEFGRAKDDPVYETRLEKIYRPRLEGLVEGRLLELTTFRKYYQILRNISLLHDAGGRLHEVAFLLPMANDRLKKPLAMVLEGLLPTARDRVRVVYLEPLLESLVEEPSLTEDLRAHLVVVTEKYVPRSKS